MTLNTPDKIDIFEPVLQKCKILCFDLLDEVENTVKLYVPDLLLFETTGIVLPKLSGATNLIEYKITESDDHSIKFLKKIPKSVKCLQLAEFPNRCFRNFFIKLYERFPDLISLNIGNEFLCAKNKSKLRKFKNLSSLSFGVDLGDKINLYIKNSGWLRHNKNLKTLDIYSEGYNIRPSAMFVLNFHTRCPFPENLEILKINHLTKINKLGEMKNGKLIRFLPFKKLKELSLPVCCSLSTNLEHTNINLIPDVGILELFLNYTTYGVSEDPIQIPESVYYLKIESHNSNLGGFNRIQIPENSAIMQIDITFHSIGLGYIVAFLSKITKKIDVKIYTILFKDNSENRVNMMKHLKENKNLNILE